MRRNLFIPLILCAGLVVSACDSQAPIAGDSAMQNGPQVQLRVTPQESLSKKGNASGVDARSAAVQAYIAQANEDLAARGLRIAIEKAEWVGGGAGHEAGQTVFAHDRTLRLSSQWIAGDENRFAESTNLTHVVDQSFSFANAFNAAPAIDGEPSIDSSMDTWNAVNCSKVTVEKRPDIGLNYSALLITPGPADSIFYADISTIGFLPGVIFDAVLGPGAAENVLGVTFTFIWIDENGNPTDLNGDGYDDTALAEVWYNDDFVWSTDGTEIDIETVALHENGHALGLGHFGKVAVTNNNNKLHVSPRAVMNAFILGTLRAPLGTDNGAYCGLYGSWPN